VSVKLLDISRADAPAVVIAEQTIKPAGKQVPIQFELRYDPQRLNERGRYSIQARILEGDKLRLIGSKTYPSMEGSGSRPDKVNIIVNPVRR
jgi:putative lipoprotein